MAKPKKRTKAEKADPFSPGTIPMLERHSRELDIKRMPEIKRTGKGEPEPVLSPFMTREDPKKWIEEASKETGVRTDTTKESKDLTRRAIEARRETEKMMGLKRGVPKKEKKKKK